MALCRQTMMEIDGFSSDLGGDIGIPIPIPPHPGAKGKETPGWREARIMRGQSLVQGAIDLRDHLPDGGLEIIETGTDFISHCGLDRSAPISYPKGSDLRPNLILQINPGRRQQ